MHLPDPRRAAVVLAGAAAFVSLYAPQSLLPLLRVWMGTNAALAGLVVSAATAGVALIAPFTGWLADRYGRRRVIVMAALLMACGGAVRGLRLLSQAGCDRARQEQFHGVDRILGRQVRWGLGYGLFGSTYGWGGWGGSIVMIEPGDRMAAAYVTNQMREPAGDTRGLEVIMAAYDGLKGLRA